MSDRLIEKLTVIGQGSFGKVFKCREIKTGEFVAMKEVNLDEDDCFDELRTEISTLLACSHQNIIRYRSSHVPKHTQTQTQTQTTPHPQSPLSNRLCIVMDYCELGSLRQVLESHGPLPENIVSEVAESILKALEYLHIQGIGHRDLKAANVLVDSSGTVKLGDFGVAMLPSDSDSNTSTTTTNNSTTTKLAGSPYWMAPEILSLATSSDHRKSYDSIKADIWSFGVTLIELLKGKPPLHYLSPSSAMKIIPKTTPPRLESSDPLASATLKDLIHSCLHDDPNKRPTATLLLKHFRTYFKSHKHSVSATNYSNSSNNNSTLLLKFITRSKQSSSSSATTTSLQNLPQASYYNNNNYDVTAAKKKTDTIFSQWDFNLNTGKSFQTNTEEGEKMIRSEEQRKQDMPKEEEISSPKLPPTATSTIDLYAGKEEKSDRKARIIPLKSIKTRLEKHTVVQVEEEPEYRRKAPTKHNHSESNKDKERNGWELKDPMILPIPPPMHNFPDLSKPQFLSAEEFAEIKKDKLQNSEIDVLMREYLKCDEKDTVGKERILSQIKNK